MRDAKKKVVAKKLSAMLKSKHVCIAVDDWTPCTSDTYMSLTISSDRQCVEARQTFGGRKQVGRGTVGGCSCW